MGLLGIMFFDWRLGIMLLVISKTIGKSSNIYLENFQPLYYIEK